MQKFLIKNIHVVNEGTIKVADVLIVNKRIEKLASNISVDYDVEEINGEGKYLLPGVIDDQVHFREPGLTRKATIYTESKAAVAGGVTSFMEMPNTVPPVFTQVLLEEKYSIAAKSSLANYSFYMGTSNNNVEEVLKTNKKKKGVCGVKIFMGSSTGNLLVDDSFILEEIFGKCELPIATHCEDEKIIQRNMDQLTKERNVLSAEDHPLVRSEEACFTSSFKAVQLAKKHNSRLHVLHISTQNELQLFCNDVPLDKKNITAEVCVHHLHFTSNEYKALGNLIKCNPAIKDPHHKEALWQGLLDGNLDVIATDHAPHLLSEKRYVREKSGLFVSPPPLGEDGRGPAAAGIPLVQHGLLLMLRYYRLGRISLEKIVAKMCHAVADCFQIQERGYIREGNFADLVIVDMNENTTVTKENILYKCGWSPFENETFPAAITHTFVNGHLVYKNGMFNESTIGRRLFFNR
ncbi:MAG: dihydroorotase [Chitinophagaceae bacterium]